MGASFRRIRAPPSRPSPASTRWAREAMARCRAAPGPPVGDRDRGGDPGRRRRRGARVAWHAAVTNPRARAPGADAPRRRELAARRAGGRCCLRQSRRRRRRCSCRCPSRRSHRAIEPLPGPGRLRRRSRRAGRAPRAPAAPASSPVTEPPPRRRPRANRGTKAQLVASAFRHLRNEGDATAALAALDERERRFGGGTLAAEAALARAEALLLLGTDGRRAADAGRDARRVRRPDARGARDRAELLGTIEALRRGRADFDALLARRSRGHARARAVRPRLLPACRAPGPARRRARSRELPGRVPRRPLGDAGSRRAGTTATAVTFSPLGA